MTTTLLKLQIQAQNAETARSESANGTATPVTLKRSLNNHLVPAHLARSNGKTVDETSAMRKRWYSTASSERILCQFTYQPMKTVLAAPSTQATPPKQKIYIKARIQKFISIVIKKNASARVLPAASNVKETIPSRMTPASTRVKETIAQRVTKAMESCLWCFETPVL